LWELVCLPKNLDATHLQSRHVNKREVNGSSNVHDEPQADENMKILIPRFWMPQGTHKMGYEIVLAWLV